MFSVVELSILMKLISENSVLSAMRLRLILDGFNLRKLLEVDVRAAVRWYRGESS